jgi:hypothetical protein
VALRDRPLVIEKRILTPTEHASWDVSASASPSQADRVATLAQPGDATYVRDGLIPNVFPEGDRTGLYHSADATCGTSTRWIATSLSRGTAGRSRSYCRRSAGSCRPTSRAPTSESRSIPVTASYARASAPFPGVRVYADAVHVDEVASEPAGAEQDEPAENGQELRHR